MSAEEQTVIHFVEKWLQREPEMQLAQVFFPAPERHLHACWAALLSELREALFELSDARVTAVKVGWWSEELLLAGQGRARHPLTQVVIAAGAAPPAAWTGAAGALLQALQAESRPADADSAWQAFTPLALAVGELELRVLGAAGSADRHAEALRLHWLSQRLLVGLPAEDAGRVPLTLLARHQQTREQLPQALAVQRDWAGELLRRAPATLPQVHRLRRLRYALDRLQLQAVQGAGVPAQPGRWRSLWTAWRAAR